MTRAILIDPFTQTLSYIELPEEPGEFGLPHAKYEGIKAAIDVKLITVFSLGKDRQENPVDMICDDEGRLKPQWHMEEDGSQTCIQKCFMAGQSLLIAGKALLVSHDKYGNTTSCGLSLEDAGKPITWLPDDVNYDPLPPVIQSFDTLDEMMALLGMK